MSVDGRGLARGRRLALIVAAVFALLVASLVGTGSFESVGFGRGDPREPRVEPARSSAGDASGPPALRAAPAPHDDSSGEHSLPRFLRLRSSRGDALPRVAVTIRAEGLEPGVPLLTDENGVVELPEADAKDALVLDAPLLGLREPIDGSEREVELVSERGLPLRVEAFDAVTGAVVEAVDYRMRFRIERRTVDIPFVRAPLTVPLVPGESATLSLEVNAPAGYTAWDLGSWRVRVSPSARALFAAVPLWPTLRMTVDGGKPSASPWPEVAVLGCRIGPFARNGPEIEGRMHPLREAAVPAMPGATLHVLLGSPTNLPGTGPGRLLSHRGHVWQSLEGSVQAVVVIPSIRGNGVLPVHVPSVPVDYPWPVGELPLEESLVLGPPKATAYVPKDQRTEVRVTVRGLAGRVETGVPVLLDGTHAFVETDDHGVATFRGLDPGEHSFRIAPLGKDAATVALVVEERIVQEADLLVVPGRRLRVHVKAEDGRGLSGAQIVLGPAGAADPLDWFLERDGIQRIDPFTSTEGFRDFSSVPGGWLEVAARWGDVDGKVMVEVGPGDVVQDLVLTPNE